MYLWFNKLDNNGKLSIIKQLPHLLSVIEKQTHKLCLAAVNGDGLILRHVLNKTPEICLAAVKQNPYALEYVTKQSLEIILAAILEDEVTTLFINKDMKNSVELRRSLIDLGRFDLIGYIDID